MSHQGTVILLAAGSGSRMQSKVKKQFMLLKDKPLLYYSLKAFQASLHINRIILVTSLEDITAVKEQIVDPYNFTKVVDIVPGGKERYDSVLCGLEAIERLDQICDPDRELIYIHDGARPFVNGEMILQLQEQTIIYDACVAAVPSKDTIKIADQDGFVKETPNRNLVWSIQTPQVFKRSLIMEAYGELKKVLQRQPKAAITDDASVVEAFSQRKVKLVKCSYENIKITTPEDIKIAEAFLEKPVK